MQPQEEFERPTRKHGKKTRFNDNEKRIKRVEKKGRKEAKNLATLLRQYEDQY